MEIQEETRKETERKQQKMKEDVKPLDINQEK